MFGEEAMEVSPAFARLPQRQRRTLLQFWSFCICFSFVWVYTGAFPPTHLLRGLQQIVLRLWDYWLMCLPSFRGQCFKSPTLMESDENIIEEYNYFYARSHLRPDGAEEAMLVSLRNNSYGFGAAAVFFYFLRM